MKGDILFITAQNIETDGRTQALISVLKSYGKINVIGWSQGGVESITTDENVNYYILNSTSYNRWCRAAAKLGKDLGCSILFVDNRRASIPGLKLKKALKPKLTVYDARELYLPRETKSFSGRIGCFFEQQMLKASDLIICANEQRKTIMEKEFICGGPIMVFDNFRKLEYSRNFSLEVAKNSYDHILMPGVFTIVSTAGAEVDRGSLALIKAAKKFQFPWQLIFLGCKESDDLERAKALVEELNVKSVHFLPRVNLDDIKYILGKSHVGVAMYHKRNANNLYCSSGKIYEFLYEGLPIATSDNPTMACVTEKYGVGESADDIGNAIVMIHKNYPEYVENVQKLVNSKVVETGQEDFKKRLHKFIDEHYNLPESLKASNTNERNTGK